MKLFLALLPLIFTGCNYNLTKGDANQASVRISAEEKESPDFQVVNQKVIGPLCVSCHSNSGGNKGGVNLEGYANVRSRQNGIYNRSLEKSDMPPDRGISQDQSELLRAWLEGGAPETVVGGVNGKPDPSLGSGPNDWAKVRDKVLGRKCAGCHGIDNPDAGLNLQDLKEVRAKILTIVDRAIVIGDMPVLPLPSLTRKERTVLTEWMNSGMPE